MIGFLPGHRAVVLEHGDVLEAAVLLEVLDALAGQRQKLRHFRVGGHPEMAVVARVLHQHLVRTHRTHLVIEAVALAQRVPFNVVKGVGVHHRTRRPQSAVQRGHRGDHLRRMLRVRTVRTSISPVRFPVGIVAGDHPGARDGVFAKLHRNQLLVASCQFESPTR